MFSPFPASAQEKMGIRNT
nr:unnamed protein product [Callosobruchus analis]